MKSLVPLGNTKAIVYIGPFPVDLVTCLRMASGRVCLWACSLRDSDEQASLFRRWMCDHVHILLQRKEECASDSWLLQGQAGSMLQGAWHAEILSGFSQAEEIAQLE